MPIIMRLDRVMADRKMSLKELSEKVGVANVNLSKMKTGKISAIRFSTLEAICEVLDCQPGDILEYKKGELKSISSAFILIGCLLVFLYTFLNMVWCKNFIMIMIIGMLSISVGTFMNGFKQNNIHIHHHVIRIIVEIVITIICWIGR